MSCVAPVNFEHIVDDFNQSGWPTEYFGQKLYPNSANFNNVQMTLGNVKWNNVSPDVEGLKPIKVVDVKAPRDTQTVVTVHDMPGSSINIVSGFMKGVPSKQATSTIPLPPAFGHNIRMSLDLTKSQQVVQLHQPSGKQVEIIGSGTASVLSEANVFQGTFEAIASFEGGVTFRTMNERTVQVRIESMAKESHEARTLRKPFYYDRNALCWKVSGNMDLTVENLQLVT